MSLFAPAGVAIAACKLAKMAELPVTMAGLRPVIKAQINGIDANFIVDSGAFYSLLSQAGAAQYKLRLAPVPINLIVSGVGGGAADVSLTTVKVFTLAGFPLKNIEFLVAGREFGGGAVGLLGQNILRAGDVEYDLAKRVIRLMRAQDCKGTLLAYWVGADQPYSVMDLGGSTLQNPQTTGTAYLNGAKLSVRFRYRRTHVAFVAQSGATGRSHTADRRRHGGGLCARHWTEHDENVDRALCELQDRG